MSKRKFTSEEMDFILDKATDSLQNLLGDSADVHFIKSGPDDFMTKILMTYMRYPILTVEVSREGCNINSGMCSVDDIIHCLPRVIGSLLALVPDSTRNDILAKAIQEDMTEDGELLNNIREHNDDEEDDD